MGSLGRGDGVCLSGEKGKVFCGFFEKGGCSDGIFKKRYVCE